MEKVNAPGRKAIEEYFWIEKYPFVCMAPNTIQIMEVGRLGCSTVIGEGQRPARRLYGFSTQENLEKFLVDVPEATVTTWEAHL